jgi:hypothetical protein
MIYGSMSIDKNHTSRLLAVKLIEKMRVQMDDNWKSTTTTTTGAGIVFIKIERPADSI